MNRSLMYKTVDAVFQASAQKQVTSYKVHYSVKQYWLNPTTTHAEAITQYYNYTRPIATRTPLHQALSSSHASCAPHADSRFNL